MRLATLVLVWGLAVQVCWAEDPGSTVIEVFTAQGCINCPPSDLVMAALSDRIEDMGPDVVALEFHTPFFDAGPWPDPHATYAWGARARKYAGRLGPEQLYIPWMVINGREQMAAKHSLEELRATIEAHRLPRVARLEIAGRVLPGNQEIEVDLAGELLEKIDATRPTLNLAIYQRRLRTEISKGDNAGMNLRDGWVVRSYFGAIFLESEPGLRRAQTLRLEIRKDWDPASLEVAVVLQDGYAGKIFQGKRAGLDPVAQ